MKLLLLLLISRFIFECESYTFENYRNSLTADDECFKVFTSLDHITQFKFFDASAKVPNGIMQGHFNNLGAYDECLAIDVPEKKVLGKYCTAKLITGKSSGILFGNIDRVNENITKTSVLLHNLTQKWQHVMPLGALKATPLLTGFTFGICRPHICQKDITIPNTLKLQFDESFCTTKESHTEMSTKARISWYIIIGFVVIGIISTIYDVVIERQGRDPHHPILISFSFYTNGKKLCKSSKNPNQLTCLNGLKTLNMIWVIAGHTYGSIVQGPIDNYADVFAWLQDYSTMLLSGATVSVDSFFTMGGILAVYSLLKSEDPGMKSSIKNVPLLYIHRYLRLTPALAIIVYISWSGLITYIADGPMWQLMNKNAEFCHEDWWVTLLFIQNYRRGNCVGQAWYLGVDMQLFLLSPLIWIPLRKWPKHTLKAMFGLVLLGIVVPFAVAFHYKLPATMIGFPTNDFSPVYYWPTHTRFGPYVIGMIAGYFIYHAQQKKRIVINPVALFWIWTLSLVILYGCIYVGYPLVIKEAPTLFEIPTKVDESARWWNSIYIALVRPAWSATLAVVIYLCVVGYGGPVNWFLSTGPMQFLAKLSYCMYLNHGIFVILYISRRRTSIHYGNWEVINILISVIVVIIPASIFHTLLFESPMISIERIIFGKNKPTKHHSSKSKEGV